MQIDEETQQLIANVMLHASILAYSIAEEIEEDHPERAEQLLRLNDTTGKLFNFFNPPTGTELEVELGDENETNN